MHDNIEQGLQIYRKTMEEYKKYFDEHGFKVGQS